ncbi:hypothetical protein AVEN_27050-1 [Araneus ventricosus]|uniref:Uncharacterized protein n=1 Tax=Araneus ventricosus TaxID=182803 RepID=A0A4Y2K5B1_ARAVE|nr:hypothetical protein AVEN_27050-1 [Araneus ventricosus]
MFGSGFLIAPNKIDFSYVFANAGFEDNLIIYLTLIISLCLYIILAIWCRWKDKKDLTTVSNYPNAGTSGLLMPCSHCIGLANLESLEIRTCGLWSVQFQLIAPSRNPSSNKDSFCFHDGL